MQSVRHICYWFHGHVGLVFMLYMNICLKIQACFFALLLFTLLHHVEAYLSHVFPISVLIFEDFTRAWLGATTDFATS